MSLRKLVTSNVREKIATKTTGFNMDTKKTRARGPVALTRADRPQSRRAKIREMIKHYKNSVILKKHVKAAAADRLMANFATTEVVINR